MKRTARMAWSGLMGALALVCLLLTVFPFATYALPALASVCLLPVVIECGKRWALTVYAAVALLALLLVPDMEARLLFVCFFGYYPIAKALIESLRRRVLEWICKLVVFNAAVAIAYAVLSAVGFSFADFTLPFVLLPLSAVLGVFLLLGNAIFVLYDIGVTRLLPLYFSRFQPLLWRFLH